MVWLRLGGTRQDAGLLQLLSPTHLSNAPACSAAPALRFRSDCKPNAPHTETRGMLGCKGWTEQEAHDTPAAVACRMCTDQGRLACPSCSGCPQLCKLVVIITAHLAWRVLLLPRREG